MKALVSSLLATALAIAVFLAAGLVLRALWLGLPAATHELAKGK